MFNCFKSSKNFYKEMDIKSQKSFSKLIDKNLKMEKKRNLMKQHILLLGTGESGKSTFLKQMKIICGLRFTDYELESFKDIIYDNIFKGVLFLLDARQQLNIEWEFTNSADAAKTLEKFFDEIKIIHRERRLAKEFVWKSIEFLQIVPYLKEIWLDKSIQETFQRRTELITENFSENSRFYLNKIDEIGVLDYCPSNEDIVWTRKPTESIIETELEVSKETTLVFIDVGGQTKERRKWCQLFQDMKSVLFLIASSHFDEEYLDRFTQQRRNKLKEAMFVFEELINQNAFLRVSVLLFFNKTDLLTEKIQSCQTNIRKDFLDFPESSDPHNIVDVQSFIVDSFVKLIDNPYGNDKRASYSRAIHMETNKRIPSFHMPIPKRTVYRHFTTAVDKTNIERVFNAMKDTVLQSNIRRIMMN